MIPLIPIIGPWLVGKLLSARPGRTDQRATFLAKVISWGALAALAVAAFLLWDWRDDARAIAEHDAAAAVQAVATARAADAHARAATDSSINEVESTNDEARAAAENSDDPLAAGLRRLR